MRNFFVNNKNKILLAVGVILILGISLILVTMLNDSKTVEEAKKVENLTVKNNKKENTIKNLTVGNNLVVANNSSLGTKLDEENEKVLEDRTEKEKLKREIIEELKKDESKNIELDSDKCYTIEYLEYLKLSDKEKSELEVIPREEEINYKELDNIIDELNDQYKEKIEKEPKEETREETREETQKETKEEPKEEKNKIIEELPSKFDLRDVIEIGVEDQVNFGICWAYAALTSLETKLALREEKNYDFSEIVIDYLLSDELYGDRKIHDGGNIYRVEDYYNKFKGFALEEDYPRAEYQKNEYLAFENIDFINPEIDCFDIINFPAGDSDLDGEEERFLNVVKSYIKSNGSLYACINTNAIAINDKNFKNINVFLPKEKCMRSDHAISLIGWDDNYSKDNFEYEGIKPSKDGAFIALNSYGKEWGEQGCFYISYEDCLVKREISGVDIHINLEKNICLEDYFENPRMAQVFIEYFKDNLFIYNNKHYMKKDTLDQRYWLEFKFDELTNFNDIKNDLAKLVDDKELEYILIKNVVFDDYEFVNLFDLWRGNAAFIFDNCIFKCNGKSVKKLSNICKITYSDCKISDNYDYTIFENAGFVEMDKMDFDLEILNNYKDLTDLNISECEITGVDKSNLDNLIQVYLYSVESKNGFDFLRKSTNIKVLRIINSDLRDVSFVQDLTNIEWVDFSENENLENLNSLKKCRIIDVRKCNLDELDLSNFDKLNMLDASENNIKTLEFSKELKYVEKIDLSNNKIEDISFLNRLETINTLDLSNNNITGVFDNKITIYYLFIRNCNLIDYTIIENVIKYITYLDISENKDINLESLVKFINNTGFDIELTSNKLFYLVADYIDSEIINKYRRDSFYYISNEQQNKKSIELPENSIVKLNKLCNVSDDENVEKLGRKLFKITAEKDTIFEKDDIEIKVVDKFDYSKYDVEVYAIKCPNRINYEYDDEIDIEGMKFRFIYKIDDSIEIWVDKNYDEVLYEKSKVKLGECIIKIDGYDSHTMIYGNKIKLKSKKFFESWYRLLGRDEQAIFDKDEQVITFSKYYLNNMESSLSDDIEIFEIEESNLINDYSLVEKCFIIALKIYPENEVLSEETIEFLNKKEKIKYLFFDNEMDDDIVSKLNAMVLENGKYEIITESETIIGNLVFNSRLSGYLKEYDLEAKKLVVDKDAINRLLRTGMYVTVSDIKYLEPFTKFNFYQITIIYDGNNLSEDDYKMLEKFKVLKNVYLEISANDYFDGIEYEIFKNPDNKYNVELNNDLFL